MSTQSPSGLRNFVTSFTDLLRCPFGLWVVIGAFVFESMSYFGVLTLMTNYLATDLKLGDAPAGVMVSVFTMLVTLFMLGLGSLVEAFGLKRAILGSLALCVVGRITYCLVPELNAGVATVVVVVLSLLVIAAGEAILQPVCYSGVKQYTDEKTSAMGYGLIYAIMNAGIVAIGTLSAWMRPAVQEIKDGQPGDHYFMGVLNWFASFSRTGVQAVNWACTGITILTLVLFLVLFTKKVSAKKLRPDSMEDRLKAEPAPVLDRLGRYFTEGPFTNTRFLFFIFMLLPVRTLFAHQWLTMPQYIIRAYDKTVAGYLPWFGNFADWMQSLLPKLAGPFTWLAQKEVADLMEWLVNWINPAIIFFGVPIATALTRHVNVYKMMVIGSLVSAAPTFLLCGGPNLNLLITYFVVFSIGEALWSARFLEYASELAPPGRIAQYMGLANIPWLLAKGTTGFYSGLMLKNYCPENVPAAQLETGTMWFWYACIAMMSPIGLWLARKWVMSGLHTKAAA